MSTTQEKSSNVTEEVKKKRNTHGTVPTKEADIISVATTVSTIWEQHPEITLVWLKPADLKKTATDFGSSYASQSKTKGSRAALTNSFQEVTKEINTSTGYVKNYIIDVFGKDNAQAYYPQFGMIKLNDTYQFPRDRERRQQALQQLLDAMGRHGMTDLKYGIAYWKDLYDRFVALKGDVVQSDSTSANNVSIKNEQKTLIRQALNSLVLLIKGNYPQTWKEQLRVWGFQKEKY